MRASSDTPRRLFLLAGLAGLLLAGPGPARVLITKEQALDRAFPTAERVEKEILYFSEAETERVEELARAPMDSRLFTTYRAFEGGRVTGYAFIDTRIVRSKAATFLVVLEPGGVIRKARVLAWQEPPEYRPPERWLAQFRDRDLDRDLRLGGAIQAISGASLTSRTLTDGVRRVLAIHRIKLADSRY